ncbi:MAG TPA: hypothetical protein VKI44_27130 [Acetobacteraceae bacterium]|nr:hypothetical protein [Acetobacteraceae bacterium]
MADNRELEGSLTSMLRVLVDRADNVTFKNRLRSAGIHVTQVFVRIDPTAHLTDDEQRRQRIAEFEHLDELTKIAKRHVPWDDFVFTCSRKIDVTGAWMGSIADAIGIHPAMINMHKAVGHVPTEWIGKVIALPDWTPSDCQSNFSKVAVPLVAALRSSGKSSSWIATTLTKFLSEFDGSKVETHDVTMTPRQ